MKGVGGEDWARGHRKVGEDREGDGGGEGGDGGEDLARGHRKVGEDREGDGGGGW